MKTTRQFFVTLSGAALLARGDALAAGTPAGAAAKPAWDAEYWAHKGAVNLYMYRKRATPPSSKAAAAPVLLLVHGSSFSGRTTYDLTVPGQTGYSMMDRFASLGYDVWTMDHEGYGRSSRTDANSDIASGVEDLKAAMEVIARETGAHKANVFGESSGAIRAAAFAVAAPDRVDRLATSAFTYTGRGAPTLEDRAKNVEFYRTHNRRPAPRELYRSIFTRDKPGTADPAVGDAIADAESKFGDTVPTGTYLDMVTKLPLVDPAKLTTPTLVARGEYDGISTEADLLDFFSKLASRDREYVVVPGAAHSLVLGYNRERFWYAVHAFLSPPSRRDALG